MESSLEEGEQLITASKEGNHSEVSRLLDQGIDVNSLDEEGWTAIIHASACGHLEVVKTLLLKSETENIWAALMEAIKCGHQPVIDALVERAVVHFDEHAQDDDDDDDDDETGSGSDCCASARSLAACRHAFLCPRLKKM